MKSLKSMSKSEGHARAPQNFITEEGFALGTWVAAQRRAYNIKRLSEDRIKALEALPGWSWDTLQDNWNIGYEQLEKYVEREGHARVPTSFKTEDGLSLGIWVKTQRKVYKKNQLSEDCIEVLEALPGWSWNTLQDNWNIGYEQLKKYAKREGHTKSTSWPKNQGWFNSRNLGGNPTKCL